MKYCVLRHQQRERAQTSKATVCAIAQKRDELAVNKISKMVPDKMQ
jgi:hypothetical protein